MNAIKKTAVFFVLVLIQNKLSAQVQNSSSVTLAGANSENNVSTANKVISNTSTVQISKIAPVQSLSNNDSTIVAPKVFDPLTMDSKPE